MAREKQFVFSARTTEEGLKALNEVKARLKVSWDELVIEAVSARYNLDKAVMALPKREKPAKAADNSQEQPAEEKPIEKAPEKKRKKVGKAK